VEEPGEYEIEVAVAAVEHYSYCPRQCALMYIEQTWDENIYTVRGGMAHERVEAGEETLVDGVRAYRSLPLHSRRLGLRGVSDVVEMHDETPYPVEYKSGRRGPRQPWGGTHADLQLCAQALCLEEMLGRPVPKGAIYYAASRTRHEVEIDEPLRRRTEELVAAVRQLIIEQALPEPANDGRCPNCSLVEACMPDVVGEPARLRSLQDVLFTPIDASADYADDAD
jgi:CRISPR-associated exonuclease Cas4